MLESVTAFVFRKAVRGKRSSDPTPGETKVPCSGRGAPVIMVPPEKVNLGSTRATTRDAMSGLLLRD
jgi:hypothetical protein